MSVQTFQTDTFTMDCCKFGKGAIPLVILPGLSVQRVMGSAEAIAEAYQPLTDDFTVYVFERRNELLDDYPVKRMAEDTAEVLRALSLGPVCLFGASQGGMIAMEIAANHPELVRRLILGSTTACVEQEERQQFESWIQLAKAGDAVGLYLAFGEAVYPPAVFESARDQLRDAARTVTEEDLTRFVILTQGMLTFDATGDLDRITCPVLVLGARDDQVLGGGASPRIAERFSGRSDCELVMYDGYGHAAYDLAPDYKEHMLRFLTMDIVPS